MWYAKGKEQQEKGDMIGEISLIEATLHDYRRDPRQSSSEQPPKGTFGWVRAPGPLIRQSQV